MKRKRIHSFGSYKVSIITLMMLFIAVVIIDKTPSAYASSPPTCEGPFTFTTIDFPGSNGTNATDINDLGDIVGSYSGQTNGFLLSGGTYTTINPSANSFLAVAMGINNNGVIVGYYNDIGAITNGMRGFKFDGNNYTTYNFPGAISTKFWGINDHEHIVGNYLDSGNVNHGFLYDGVNWISINVPGAANNANGSSANDIDNAGNIVGGWTDGIFNRGFIYNGSTYTKLNDGSNTTQMFGINELGIMVGVSMAGGNGSIPPVYSGLIFDGTDYCIFTIPGAVGINARGINNLGSIVGVIGTNGNPHGFVTPAIDVDVDGSFPPVDCDDNDNTVYPGAPELCDEKDNDCNGIVDDITNTYWVDGDGDGYGDPAFPDDLIACSTPIGYSDNSDDCDDADATVYPGASELCDGKDNDCDGVVPANELDEDGDGVSECAGDCDVLDPSVYPGAPELCDGKDNDCDGVVPANEIDNDGDRISECEGDCNDADATINPGARDIPENGIDEDCNGSDQTWAEQIGVIVDAINSLDPGVFDKPKDQDKLAKDLGKTLKAIEEGKEKQAIKNLDKVLEETDGCALRGTPDTKGKKKMKNKEDSIQDCNAQALIYPLVLESIQLLGQHI